MILGYNTNGLAHHDPFDAVEILAEIGYRAIALTIDHLTLTPFGNTYLATRQVDLLAKTLEEAKMRSVVETGARFLLDPRRKHEPTFISPEAKGRDLRYEFMRHCIDTAQTLKSDCVSVWSGRLLDDVPYDLAMDRLVASLEPVLDYAAERDVTIGFEPEPGMLIDTMEKFDELQQRIDAPNFQLTLDIGHLHCQGETPIADYVRQYGDRIVNIHLEDMKAGVHEHLPFGEGEIDFPPIFNALKEIDYSGCVNVELSRHSHDGPNMAKQSYEFLKPLIQRLVGCPGFLASDLGLEWLDCELIPDPAPYRASTPMADNVVLLSIPGLRASDVAHMPNLTALTEAGDKATLVPSFPAVTLCVETNIMTGMLPVDHGVVANGWYDREKGEVELWTMGNEAIDRPQIWDTLKQHNSSLTSAVWFPMLSKRCSADYVCMPAPVHNPDGSESLWCYTRPTEYYGELLEQYGHFPLKFFWGPLASIPSTKWISDTAVLTAKKHKPNFFYIYLPHLDYQAQKLGPDSEPAMKAVAELDVVLGEMFAGLKEAYGDDVLILVASEYTIVPVDHVTYPNRVLREAGLVKVNSGDEGETIDYRGSDAFAVADHQLSHIYVKDSDQATIDKVVKLFEGQEGIAEVLAGANREKYFLNHERSGDVILVSTANSWQAYYYWLDDANAPKFARTVDIHRKPGYDPVELHVDMATKSIPLDATLVKGSHGAPAKTDAQRGVLLSNQKGVYPETPMADTDVSDLVLRQFNI